MRTRIHPRLPQLLALLALAGAAGCAAPTPDGGPDAGTPNGIFGKTGGANVASVNGYSWDPEAYWISFANCGQTCPIPPILVPGVPLFESSVIRGAVVSLYDPVQGAAAGSDGPTGTEGNWFMQDVLSRPSPPFYLSSVHKPASLGGAPALQTVDPLPPVPAANYLPTFSLRAVYTRYTTCLALPAELISDAGITEAVARYLTANSRPTTVADLLDPTKFGGVVVWWLYMPLGDVLRVPAFGTAVTASAGQVLNINWAPPGVLPPSLHQSTRGFYVDDGAPVSGIGVTVTLLPPSSTPTSVTFTMVDPPSDPSNFVFPKLSPMQISPGRITFGQIEAIQDGVGPPGDTNCVQ